MWGNADTSLVPTNWPLETSIFHFVSCCPRPPQSCPVASWNYNFVCAVMAPAGLRQSESVLAQAAALDVLRLPELGFG